MASCMSESRLYFERFQLFPALVPPLEEQRQIARTSRKRTASSNAVLARAYREIDLLREYRTRLTADAVTGTLDVREAAQSCRWQLENRNSFWKPRNRVTLSPRTWKHDH